MATTENSVILTMGYKDTNFTRKYQLNNVDASALVDVKAKVMEYNANLPEQDKNIFISDDYDPIAGKGTLTGIVAASYKTVTYERINLN